MGAHEQGADATAGRWTVIPRTLCFVTYEQDVLLLLRGPERRVFPNKYNGVGGHLERDEDVLSGAVREIKEETGLDVRHVQYCGCSHVDAGGQNGILVLIFKAEATTRDFMPSDEGLLEWIPQEQILAYDLVEDLPVMLPRVLAMEPGDSPFFAHLSYGAQDHMHLFFADLI